MFVCHRLHRFLFYRLKRQFKRVLFKTGGAGRYPDDAFHGGGGRSLLPCGDHGEGGIEMSGLHSALEESLRCRLHVRDEIEGRR